MTRAVGLSTNLRPDPSFEATATAVPRLRLNSDVRPL